MAKAKRAAKIVWAKASKALAALDYRRCSICSRDMKDLETHADLHARGILGDDGKRTDRSKDEARRWAERYNGREATEKFRAKPAKPTKARGAKKKPAAKRKKATA